jgi:hypothetical protein
MGCGAVARKEMVDARLDEDGEESSNGAHAVKHNAIMVANMKER